MQTPAITGQEQSASMQFTVHLTQPNSGSRPPLNPVNAGDRIALGSVQPCFLRHYWGVTPGGCRFQPEGRPNASPHVLA